MIRGITGVSANCLHPGMVDTGIWRNVPVPLSWFLQLIIKSFFKTPVQEAQTTIHIANAISERYVWNYWTHRAPSQVMDWRMLIGYAEEQNKIPGMDQ